MIKITDKRYCCGCSACAQKCPKHCITMTEDEEGFVYPVVNHQLCIDCGLCEKVCVELNPFPISNPNRVYAVKHSNDAIRMDSSSGGLFSALAEHFITNKKAIVFGVKFDKTWNAVFSWVDNVEDLAMFRGSKYVQADICNAYVEAEQILKTGRFVLFSGTSCQIAGLKKFLGRDYTNLFTVDFICHGVPSPMVWRKFLNESLGNHSIDTVHSIRMRNKNLGWRRFSLLIKGGDALGDYEIQKPFAKTSYGKLFLSDNILRLSCFYCPSKSGRSKSDLTLADFWGANKLYKEHDDNKGITLAIINSESAESLIHEIKSIKMFEPTLEEAFEMNGGYYRSVAYKDTRELCFKQLKSGFTTRCVAKNIIKENMSFVIKDYVKMRLEQLGLWKR